MNIAITLKHITFKECPVYIGHFFIGRQFVAFVMDSRQISIKQKASKLAQLSQHNAIWSINHATPHGSPSNCC